MLTDGQLAILHQINSSIAFDGDGRGEADKLVIDRLRPKGRGSLATHSDRREGAARRSRARGRAKFRNRRQHRMTKKQSSRGRKRERACAAGGQDHGLRYEAKKSGKSKAAVDWSFVRRPVH
jgi:hypothetical protein